VGKPAWAIAGSSTVSASSEWEQPAAIGIHSLQGHLPYTLVAKNAQREYAAEILKDRKAGLFSVMQINGNPPQLHHGSRPT
jgi:hypothetical protein